MCHSIYCHYEEHISVYNGKKTENRKYDVKTHDIKGDEYRPPYYAKILANLPHIRDSILHCIRIKYIVDFHILTRPAYNMNYLMGLMYTSKYFLYEELRNVYSSKNTDSRQCDSKTSISKVDEYRTHQTVYTIMILPQICEILYLRMTNPCFALHFKNHGCGTNDGIDGDGPTRRMTYLRTCPRAGVCYREF